MKQVKVSLEEKDLETLENLSRDLGISVSALIRSAVKRALVGRFWLKEARKHE